MSPDTVGGSKFQYEPSPAHKVTTSEAGPPRWIPFKEKCPPDMALDEREGLLAQSFAASGDPEDPRRYAVRRTVAGLEFYECKLTRRTPDGTFIVHGHPTRRVPPSVLRQMLAARQITEAEYRWFLKELG